MPALHTFGDSILDCGRYNAHGVHPAGLVVRNRDDLFPGFRGRDLASLGVDARLDHRAEDGARVDALARQARGARVAPGDVALVTIGGNDLLGGLVADHGPGLARFEATLAAFLAALPRGRVLMGNVYDPTFGDDAENFLPVDPALARRNLRRVNDLLAALAARHGALVDIHGHFLERGDPSWFTQVVEPSLMGASEVRRAFLPRVEDLLGRAEERAGLGR